MSPTSQLFSAIAWTLIHSLWQGALAALIYRGARAITASAGIRYAVGHLTIAAFILLQAATFAYTISHRQEFDDLVAAVSTHPQAVAPHGQNFLRLPPSPVLADLVVKLEPLFPWIAAVWLAGLAAHLAWMSVILTAMWWEIRRCVEVAEPFQAKLREIARRLRGTQTVRFLECASVTVPGTVGWLRPVVLVPAGWLLATPAREVEAIILHELAHIARGDFLGSLVRHAVGAIYYFNLPLRWQLKALAGDAEQASDALAADAYGDIPGYSEALYRLDVGRSSIALVLGADGGSLKERIRHLSVLRRGLPKRVGRILAMGLIGTLSALSVCYGAVVATMNRNDVVWLEHHTLPSGTVELLSKDRANPEAEKLLSELHQMAVAGQPLTDDKLLRLATSLRNGFDSGRLVREADVVDARHPLDKIALPTFGTRKSRTFLVKSLRELSERESGESAMLAARAALTLAAIDLCDDGAVDASELIRTNESLSKLGLSSAERRRLEMLLAVHTRRLNQVLKLAYSDPKSGTLDEASLHLLLSAQDHLPGAWHLALKAPNIGVRKQIAAALGRGEN